MLTALLFAGVFIGGIALVGLSDANEKINTILWIIRREK